MKFKKIVAGEYEATGTFNGEPAKVEAVRQDAGGFAWSAYLSGSYVQGDGCFPLGMLKQNLERNPSYFFE